MTEEKFLSKILPSFNTCKQIIVPAGDDCAVFQEGDSKITIACDQIIEDRHFTFNDKAQHVGRKLLARNISDFAAMGATPKYCVLSIAFKKDYNEQWLLDLHEGINSLAKQFNIFIIGGDLSKSWEHNVLSLTLVGEQTKKAVLRKNAKIDDIVCITNKLGNSFKSKKHLLFEPRLQEGLMIANYANSMIDISDGLIKDLTRICKASNTSAKINLNDIPLNKNASLEQALYQGEDYELLFTLSKQNWQKIQQNWTFNCTISAIGTIIPSNNNLIEDMNHNKLPNKGYDHFI